MEISNSEYVVYKAGSSAKFIYTHNVHPPIWQVYNGEIVTLISDVVNQLDIMIFKTAGGTTIHLMPGEFTWIELNSLSIPVVMQKEKDPVPRKCCMCDISESVSNLKFVGSTESKDIICSNCIRICVDAIIEPNTAMVKDGTIYDISDVLFKAEEFECAKIYLDINKVPTVDKRGDQFSLVGRIGALADSCCNGGYDVKRT